jgi:hypothetical protein
MVRRRDMDNKMDKAKTIFMLKYWAICTLGLTVGTVIGVKVFIPPITEDMGIFWIGTTLVHFFIAGPLCAVGIYRRRIR